MPRSQGKLPTPLTAHAPQCRRRRASASWPQPGRGTSNRMQAGSGKFIPKDTTSFVPRRTPVLSQQPSHKATAAVYLSFNGRRPPDAPLFQPQLIAALPFSFQCPSVCVARPSVTCQKHGGRLVSPCAPARWGGAACLVYVHGREGVPLYHPASDPDRLCQPGNIGCKSNSPYLPKLPASPQRHPRGEKAHCPRTSQWHIAYRSHTRTVQTSLLVMPTY